MLSFHQGATIRGRASIAYPRRESLPRLIPAREAMRIRIGAAGSDSPKTLGYERVQSNILASWSRRTCVARSKAERKPMRPPFTTIRGAEDYGFWEKRRTSTWSARWSRRVCWGRRSGAGTLFLVFGTSAPSYVKTAFHKVRQNVKESVDPQFEIDRARQDIENLKPMFDQNKETLARAEVEAENLESEVGTMQANLEKAKADDPVDAAQAQDG